MSIKAYQVVQDKVTDPRRIEISVFQRCNALLRAAATTGTGDDDAAGDPLAVEKRRAQALFEHERLWISLLGDLASDDNQLPAVLRAQLISLGLWSCRHADSVRKQNAPLEPLIALNSQMIAGLTESLEGNRDRAPDPNAPTARADAPILT